MKLNAVAKYSHDKYLFVLLLVSDYNNLFSLFSCLSPTVCQWRQVQREGQVSLSAQLHWKVLSDARSEWTAAAAPANIWRLQPDSGPLHAYVAPHLRPRPESW